MPPKSDMWELFERLDNTGKGGKYLTDKTHFAAWCRGCLDRYVEDMFAADAVKAGEGEVVGLRTKAEWRTFAKKSELAELAATWKGDNNIHGSLGVIPICGKVKTMLIHARNCPYVTPEALASVDHAGGNAGSENISPQGSADSFHFYNSPTTPSSAPFYSFSFSSSAPFTPSTWPCSPGVLLPPGEESPSKRRKLKDIPGKSREPPAALRSACPTTSPERTCQCDCHSPWTAEKQQEFARDLSSVFIVCDFAFNAAANPQMALFFAKWLPLAKVPDRRQIGGPQLDAMAISAVADTCAIVKGRYATGQSDGWKNIVKQPILGSTMNVNRQAYPIRTHDMSGRPKTGDEHFEVIKEDIKYMEATYGVKAIAWVTDDGPDGKRARNLLQKLWSWIIVLLCWAHQLNLLVGDYLTLHQYRDTVNDALDVVKWFNNHGAALDLFRAEQLTAYPERTHPLALLLPVITRWTAHYHAVKRLLDVRRAMICCVVKHKERLLEIAAHARTKEAKEMGVHVIGLVQNEQFWDTLTRVTVHLQPLAIATNILQASHARLDHVLLTLGNLYHFYTSSAIEPDVRDHMLSRLELRWKKGADQDIFIMATILNPYVRRSCFNCEVLSEQDIENMAKRTFERLFQCTPDQSFFNALQDYLDGVGAYSDLSMNLTSPLDDAKANGKDIDLIRIWRKLNRANKPIEEVCTDHNGLPRLAIRLLSVVANTGDTERLFSAFGLIHTRLRNRLSSETVHKAAVVRKWLSSCHAAAGIISHRLKRRLGSDIPAIDPIQSPSASPSGAHSSPTGHELDLAAAATGPTPASEPLQTAVVDFQTLGDELVEQSIRSRERFEAEHPEVDDEEQQGGAGEGDSESAARGDEGLNVAAQRQSAASHIPTAVSNASAAPRRIRRTQTSKPKKTSLPLKDLFLFPSSNPATTAAGSQSAESDAGHSCGIGFGFVWTRGVLEVQREVELSEQLQPSNES